MENVPQVLPANTHIKWATHPAEAASLHFIEGTGASWKELPTPNEVLVLPFIVDPQTREPVPVRVVNLVEFFHENPPVLAVVVSRDQ